MWFIPFTPKSMDETYYFPTISADNPLVRGWVRVAYSTDRPVSDYATASTIKADIIDKQLVDTTISASDLYTHAKSIASSVYDTYNAKDKNFIGVSVQLVLDATDAPETTAQVSKGYISSLKFSPTQ